MARPARLTTGLRTVGLAALLAWALAAAPHAHAASVAGTVIQNEGTVNPNGVAVDSSGDIFVADCSTVCLGAAQNGVYKLTPDGMGGYTVTQLATDTTDPGNTDIDSAGTVFVADYGDNRIVTLTPQGGGTTYTEGQVQGFTGDGPNGIAVARDSFGNLYVADANDGTIDKLTPGAGGVYTQATIATIPGPTVYDLAVDGAGNVYVIQQPGGTSSPATVYKIRPLGGGGYDAPAAISTGLTADGLAVDGAGVVYLPDDNSTNARVYTLTPDAAGTTYTQSSFDVTGVGNFNLASGITVTPSGDIIVSDSENNRLVVVAGAAVGASGYTLPANQAATPELGSGELLTTGLLPLGAVLLCRRRRTRRAMRQE